MLRFVDLTLSYWPYKESAFPCCAIVDTVTNKCLPNSFGCHVHDSIEEVREAGGERAVALVPDGFFEGNLADIGGDS